MGDPDRWKISYSVKVAARREKYNTKKMMDGRSRTGGLNVAL